MGEIEASGGISGLFAGKFRKVASFPASLRAGEVMIHELKCEKNTKYLGFYVGKDNIPIGRLLTKIPKKED